MQPPPRPLNHPPPNMAFNSQTHRDYLHSLKSYLPAADFLPSYGWNQDGSANVLIDKQNKEPAVAIIVGKVVHDHVFCGPSGNWSTGNEFRSLKDAKYQFTICHPDDEIFSSDYESSFKKLGKVQFAIATTQDRRNLLVDETEKLNNIRFSAPVFKERDSVSTYFPVVPLTVNDHHASLSSVVTDRVQPVTNKMDNYYISFVTVYPL
jgi:hypothetical protein